jgi:hypothetical protein
MHATCSTHFILDLVTLIKFGGAYKLWSSSLCSLLQSSITSSRLGPNILSALCSQTPSVCVLPLVWETKFHTHTKQQVKL